MSQRRKSVESIEGEELEEEPKTIPVKQVDMPVMAVAPAAVPLSGEEKRAYAMMKIQSMIRSYIWRDFLVRTRGEMFLDDLVKTAMDNEAPPAEGAGMVVELEPVDVYLPADFQGVLDHGTVVNGPERIVGVDISTTKEDEWIVDEIEDVGEFEEYEKFAERAAITVQRFYRKRIARKKFRQMVEEAIQAAREGRPIAENLKPESTTTGQAENSSATSNCVLM